MLHSRNTPQWFRLWNKQTAYLSSPPLWYISPQILERLNSLVHTVWPDGNQTHYLQGRRTVVLVVVAESLMLEILVILLIIDQTTSDVSFLLDRLQRGPLHQELHQLGSNPLLVGVSCSARRLWDTRPGGWRENITSEMFKNGFNRGSIDLTGSRRLHHPVKLTSPLVCELVVVSRWFCAGDLLV